MIELLNLQKVVNQATVIDIESLIVAPGEIAALIGTIDSGKEILLKLLLGQSRPTVGTIKLAGLNPREQKSAFSRKIGLLFAEDSLYARQSARANLHLYCQLHGLPKSRIDEVLAQVGLADQANVRVEKLPTGLARRLAFGRAILHQPEILILVEPFIRCDGVTISLLSKQIRDFSNNNGSVLVLDSDPTNLVALCDVIYRLEHGRIVETRHPDQLQRTDLPFKIPVRLEGKVILVNPGDIFFAMAEEGNTYLLTREARLPIPLTLADLEQRLARSGFFRAHRGYLVNLQHIKEVIQFTRNSYNLRLDDPAQTEIPLSKTAAAELSALLGF